MSSSLERAVKHYTLNDRTIHCAKNPVNQYEAISKKSSWASTTTLFEKSAELGINSRTLESTLGIPEWPESTYRLLNASLTYSAPVELSNIKEVGSAQKYFRSSEVSGTAARSHPR